MEWPPEANVYPEANGASKEAATNGTNGVKVSENNATSNAMKVVKTKTKMVSESSVYHNSAGEMHHPSGGVIKSNYEL